MRLTLLLSVIIAAATISKGGQVVLTSDPPGSSIFVGGKQLGTTPLTADLPPGPIEVTSRFGALAPVVQTLTPDDAQVVAFHFKHSYGTLIVSSDRADAALTIDGTNFGHPPALLFLTPGTHKVFITATNAPDKTRNVDVVEGQRATVEIHFTGSSPETVTSGPGPTVSASPTKSSSSPTAPPVKESLKPKPSPQLMVWQEPPSTIPLASASPGPKVSVQASPQPKASQTAPRNTTRLARAQASPSATPDPAKAKALLKTEWKAKESALAAEKQRIQYEIANSTGVTREQWKYKLGLWRLKKEQVEASAKAEPSKTYAVAASPSATPDPAKTKAEYAFLQTEWKAKQSALAAEKQRIEYEIKNSTGATRKQWEYKLGLWNREEAQAERDQAAAKARLSNSRGRGGTP
jgi:PEGA domain-containing protein